jgi:hypothetical protein
MAIIPRIYQPDEERTKRELELALRKAEAAARAPRHVRHGETKHLLQSERARQLIVDHGFGSSWFRCACGLSISWAYKKRGCQRLLDPTAIQTGEQHGVFRGTCPGCGDVHWKRASLAFLEEWLAAAKQI